MHSRSCGGMYRYYKYMYMYMYIHVYMYVYFISGDYKRFMKSRAGGVVEFQVRTSYISEVQIRTFFLYTFKDACVVEPHIVLMIFTSTVSSLSCTCIYMYIYNHDDLVWL